MADLLPAEQAILAVLADVDAGRVEHTRRGPRLLTDDGPVTIGLDLVAGRGWITLDGARYGLTQRGLDVLEGRRPVDA